MVKSEMRSGVTRRRFIFGLIFSIILFSVISYKVSAEKEYKLPFTLTAPENVYISYEPDNYEFFGCTVSWSQNDSMSEWLTRMEDPESHDAAVEELNAMGYDDVWITPQLDWSLDSQDDWHYNKYWDTDGYDEDYVQRLGEWAYISFLHYGTKTNEGQFFGYKGNIDDPDDVAWNGSNDYPGWKDVLKEDQYEIITVDDTRRAIVDLTKHTLYARMRYLVTVRPTDGEDVKIASDWSEIASVGKEASNDMDLVKDLTIEAPKISGLRMTDEEFNTFPVIAFTIDVTDSITELETVLKANRIGVIWLQTEARVMGKSEWTELQGDISLKSGEFKIDLQNLAEAEGTVSKDTPIELRAKYVVYANASTEGGTIESPYSEILSFGSPEMQVTENTTEDVTTETTGALIATQATTEDTVTPEKPKEKKDKCSLCGFCPHPLGICIFIWIVILAAIIFVVVWILVKKRKDKEK